MAHTSAHAEDASVAFFNPAGMSFIPSKLSIAIGGFAAGNKVTFQNLNTLQSTETDNPIGTPLYGAITYKPLEKLSVGFSFLLLSEVQLNILTTGKGKKWYKSWSLRVSTSSQ